MKARIPVKLKKEAMAEINRLADREYQKVKDKEIADATRRIFKTIVFALHKDFGFGRDRCAKTLKSMTEIMNTPTLTKSFGNISTGLLSTS